MRRLLGTILAVCLAVPVAAGPMEQIIERRQAAARSLAKVADCTVAKQPDVTAEWLLIRDPRATWPSKLNKAISACLSGDLNSSFMKAQNSVWRGILGMGFVRHPEHIPAGLVAPPLPVPATADFDIVTSVAACVIATDAVGARSFVDAIAGLPEEKASFDVIAPAATRCVQPWPDVEINAPMMRAGLGFALFRKAVADAAAGSQ
ncbi:MAG: hypothetical protein ACOYO0_11545 [Sandarakinorhabdus sp.]